VASARLVDVSRRFGSHVALDHVSLSINGGNIVGLAGPNGAGKTTLLRVLAGLLRPSDGLVQIQVPPAGVRYFGGEHTLPSDVSAHAWDRLWRGSDGAATKQRFGVLSRGTRQRLGLTAVLRAEGATLIILDEPWEGLDPDASRWLSEVLMQKRAGGAAVLVSSHRIHDLASTCDRCAFLVKGRLAPIEVRSPETTSLNHRVAQLLAAFDQARETL
jgi:ABC-type multidrug transport system ATPase subunit